ncbi:YtxH domain-containing protein [Cohnella sp. LGH]|uniref:YtxH domain-containing protein n=1 Tax=Cohnella sp. LGH TaxID=1619153 RepID=UPI001ADC64B8|nr:YtxH domain-containing protein [Cohnella sp. LGH]QTH44822.1 YtxH domain-containing protein [Cohnella sp. LGH]
MKIGTFVMGGLAGAALAIWFQRNRNLTAAMATAGQNVKERMMGMKDDAVEKAMNMKFASSFRRLGAESGNEQHRHHTSRQASSHSNLDEEEGGMEQIRKLISQDPEVGKEVDAILGQNGHPHN